MRSTLARHGEEAWAVESAHAFSHWGGTILWQNYGKPIFAICWQSMNEQFNLAIAAVQNGYTTREVEVALREIRMAAKSSMKNPDNEALYCALGNTVDILRSMGGIA